MILLLSQHMQLKTMEEQPALYLLLTNSSILIILISLEAHKYPLGLVAIINIPVFQSSKGSLGTLRSFVSQIQLAFYSHTEHLY